MTSSGGVDWGDENGADGDHGDGAGEDTLDTFPREARSRPARRIGAVLAALAVAAVVIGYARAAHQSPHAAASPSPLPVSTVLTVPPTTTGPSDVVRLGDRHGTLRNDAEVQLPGLDTPPSCHQVRDSLSHCRVQTAVPAAFLTAVRARFPHARLSAARTETLTSTDARGEFGLWSRQFTGRSGSRVVRVLVSPGDATYPLPANSVDDGSQVIDYAAHQAQRFTVEVRVSAPSGTGDSLTAAEALSRDPRLVALP